jgi:titin
LLTGDGLLGVYYDGLNFTGATVSRVDPNVNFNWGSGNPAPSIDVDDFSVRWTGQVETTIAGTYTFRTDTDDGVRLWVNGVQLINDWTNHGVSPNFGTISLGANTRYNLTMEYYDGSRDAIAQLSWTVPGGSSAIIPQANLYTTADVISPKVVSFTPNDGGSDPRVLTAASFVFSEDVAGSIDAGDLTIFNGTTGQTVNTSGATFVYTVANKQARWDLTSLNLPAGFYTVSLTASGISDVAGNKLDGDGNGTGGDDWSQRILVALDGDANLDGMVDVVDLGILATHYGVSSGATWGMGDSTGDGAVDVADLGLLATNYGRNLTPFVAAPSALTATTISESQINLVWTDNADNEANFKIERKQGAGGTWAQIAAVGANVTTYSDSGLAASTQFYYRVRAVNASVDSAYSAEVNATTSASVYISYSPIASSFLGSDSTGDAVRATMIQADGTIVLVSNIGNGTPGGMVGTLLNGAAASTGGAIVRLTSDGNTVLSVTRFVTEVRDASLDALGNMYVASGTDGLIKLNADASAVLWKQTGFTADRVDAAPNGDVVVLQNCLDTDEFTPMGQGVGSIQVFNSAGVAYAPAFGAHNKTYDIAIDSVTASVFTTGFRQWNNSTIGPVQIAFMRSQDYTGTIQWNNYDWTEDQVDGVGEVNNLADTRGLRIDMGADGKLYVAFLTAGGNHIFRYSPTDLPTPVSIVGGDQYHQFYNSASEHKTFFARYEPATGAYLTGQQLTARLTTGAANTCYLAGGGDIQADAEGRVYLTGVSGSGGGTSNTLPGLPFTFNPVASDQYGGGAFLLIMSPDFATRLYVGRMSSGCTSTSVAARTVNGELTPRVVYGGYGDTTYTRNPIQPANAGGQDGVFAVLQGVTIAPAAPSGLSATAINSSQINLTWTDNSNNEDSFIIERRLGTAGAWGPVVTLGPGNTAYSDSGLSPTTQYSYRVKAHNALGDSASSNEATATTLVVSTPPSAPGNLTATPASSSQISLTWTDTSDIETSFKIERKQGAGGTWAQVATAAANAIGYTDFGLTAQTEYFYRVFASNAFGDSPSSSEANATTMPISGNGPFVEAGGTVVMEAEHYTGNTQRSDDVSWINQSGSSGYVGEGYATTPTSVMGNGAWDTGAEISFDINFTTTGSFKVYIRRWAVDGGNNSVFAGLDGVATSAYDNQNANYNQWVWYQLGTVTVTTPGYHTFQIRRRENRYQIDRIVLTTSSAPTGAGPVESLREAGTPTLPANPTGMTATAVSSTQINLGWNDGSNNEDCFLVDRKIGAEGTWEQLGTVGPNVTSYSDTGLVAATQYYYRVRASNGVGDSGCSNEANATTIVNPPAAPSDLAATAVSPSQISLTWTDNSTTETSYKIERKNGTGGDWSMIGNANADQTTYTDNGLNPSTQYYYRVRANNPGGDSGYSNEAGTTTLAPTAVPANPTGLGAIATSAHTINLAWTDASNSENFFKIERKQGVGGTWSQIGTVGANVTTYADSGLSASTDYYYRVRANNVVGDSGYSNEADAVTAAPVAPAAPVLLRVTGGWSTAVSLAWTDKSGSEDGFRIERSTNGTSFTQIDSVGADVVSYTDSTTSAGTQYYYRVRAYNVDGNSGYTNIVHLTTNVGDAIINDNPTYTGPEWNGNAYAIAFNGNYYDDKNANKGEKTAYYSFSLPSAGTYEVYLYNIQYGTTGATNTPIDIVSAGGTTTVVVDQKNTPTGWTYLGTWSFNAGSGTSVTIRNTGTNGYVFSDAIRFLPAATGVPATPTDFAVTTLNSSQIFVSWTDAATNDREYIVERSLDGVNFSALTKLPPNATGYNSSALSPLTTYYYRVKAVNAAGASAYTAVLSTTTADEAIDHVRLFLDPERITELKAAIAVPGSTHADMFNAMKARCDANDWHAYDTDTNDGGKGFSNLMRSYLARENALMYLLTDNMLYANQAYDALYKVYSEPDASGNLPDSGSSGLYRAMTGEGFAIAYDWCFSAWSTVQRDWVRGKIRAALDAWPSFNHTNISYPYASNWNGVCRSGELILMLSIPGEEVARADRFATIKSQLNTHMNTAFGPSGWTQEGIGYGAYELTHVIPAVQALHSIGDTSLDAQFYSKAWWQLAMVSGSFGDQWKYPQTGVDAGVEGNLQSIGFASLVMSTVPAVQVPYYRWWYDHNMGIDSPLSAGLKYDFNRAGTVWAMLYYPESQTSVDPDGNVARTVSDSARGIYVFRNQWQDGNDIIVSSMTDKTHQGKAWESAEGFNINLIAFNTRFFGGGGKVGGAVNYSTLLVDNRDPVDTGDTGSTDFYSSQPNGCGYLIADGGLKYSHFGLTSAKRHTMVDFSGVTAPLVMSTLDSVQADSSHTYTWNLNLGDEIDNDGITVDTGVEAGVPIFVLHGNNNSYVKGWMMTGGTLAGPGVAANGTLKVDVSAVSTDIWVVMLCGQGAAPTGSIVGAGLSAVLSVNGGEVRFDSVNNRIVSTTGGAQGMMIQSAAPVGDVVVASTSNEPLALNLLDSGETDPLGSGTAAAMTVNYEQVRVDSIAGAASASSSDRLNSVVPLAVLAETASGDNSEVFDLLDTIDLLSTVQPVL